MKRLIFSLILLVAYAGALLELSVVKNEWANFKVSICGIFIVWARKFL
jgi:hypothetical protein